MFDHKLNRRQMIPVLYIYVYTVLYIYVYTVLYLYVYTVKALFYGLSNHTPLVAYRLRCSTCRYKHTTYWIISLLLSSAIRLHNVGL